MVTKHKNQVLSMGRENWADIESGLSLTPIVTISTKFQCETFCYLHKRIYMETL